MNTSTYEFSAENVAVNERALRTIFGMGLLILIIIGGFITPSMIFGLSILSIYLVITAIMGIDLVYSLVGWLTQVLTFSREEENLVFA